MISREKLEENQISIYIVTLLFAVLVGIYWAESSVLTQTIEPVIGILLYSMFCQIPFLELKKSFSNGSFFKALLVGNFIGIPILIFLLLTVFPLSPLWALGVLLVLLTPCIDYVIVFTHLGKGDSKLILAATPFLFVFQMVLLPLYLWFFAGKETMKIIEITPFITAFITMIVVPLLLAISTQIGSNKEVKGIRTLMTVSSWLPVPFMALTFFVVISSQITNLLQNPQPILGVLPIYISFAVAAPLIGVLASKIYRLNTAGTRAVSFSTSTRNSLVVLPLALALPVPQNQIVAVVIVTQTIVEIAFELIYIRVFPLFIKVRKRP